MARPLVYMRAHSDDPFFPPPLGKIGAMRTEASGRNLKGYWPKGVVRKWLNLRSRKEQLSDDSSSDHHHKCTGEEVTVVVERRRRSCSDKDSNVDFVRNEGLSGRGWLGAHAAHADGRRSKKNLRVFVGTWNVGGRAPHGALNLRDWLAPPSSAAADIYVLGFQEIVPLNAGNVLGGEDRAPAAQWLSLIQHALNSPRRTASFLQADQKPRVSFSDLLSAGDMDDEEETVVGEIPGGGSEPSSGSDEDSAEVFPVGRLRGGGYSMVASKQMVGVFLCVWMRAELLPHVRRVRTSCVARGIMGYMGNKGSISISMTVGQTTFCFVCAHLTSGERDGDEVRRNCDVMEIMKRTRFPQSRKGLLAPELSPASILQHDKIIWLGDLNYRVASSCIDTNKLVQNGDWEALLEKDQLRIEQKAGRIFAGWEEGKICFPPTYKYIANSDHYALQGAKSRDKRRTPAWCDRILWRGEGMKQIGYVRGESRFSDHRPVHSLFSIQLVDDNEGASNNSSNSVGSTIDGNNKSSGRGGSSSRSSNCRSPKWPVMATRTTSNTSTIASSTTCASRVQAEELFLVTRTQSCLEASRFR